jgi:hypothetical protein
MIPGGINPEIAPRIVGNDPAQGFAKRRPRPSMRAHVGGLDAPDRAGRPTTPMERLRHPARSGP